MSTVIADHAPGLQGAAAVHDGPADVATGRIRREPRRKRTVMTPRPVPGERGLVTVDVTWGVIAPMQLAPGVRTVGELEVLEHIQAGLPLIDTRLAHFYREGTIPGARNVPHGQITEVAARLDRSTPAVFFCNGPQCAATPDAIHALLDAGWPAAAILYYRGGIHDWATLGLPLE